MNIIYRFVDYLNYESCFGSNAEIDVIIPSLTNKKCRDITDRQNVNTTPYKININSKNKILVEYESIKPIMLLNTDVMNGTGKALFLNKVVKISKIYSNEKIEEMSEEIEDYLSNNYENIITNDFNSIINNSSNTNYFYRTSIHDDNEDTQGILVKTSDIIGNEILLEMEIMKRYLKGEIKKENYDEYLLHLKELINNLNYEFEQDYVEDYFYRIDNFDINQEDDNIKDDNIVNE